MTTGLDRTYHAHRFIFSFTFYLFFVPCGGLSWLPVSFLLHVKYTLSYRIVDRRDALINAPCCAVDFDAVHLREMTTVFSVCSVLQ